MYIPVNTSIAEKSKEKWELKKMCLFRYPYNYHKDTNMYVASRRGYAHRCVPSRQVNYSMFYSTL